MKRTLWTVFTDHRLVAVVVADKLDGARRIVAALAERNDLPDRPEKTLVMPCTRRQAAKVLRQADTMGIGDRFLAFLASGVFLTGLGELSPA
ncbi:MAG: hypothetical protein HQL45_12705 [Alphaproteobacteria bacterium]|jgi:hypothetical protein|nr:hypothetical protein [Alphaproteobacteria bacterium]MBF0355229.1 hypothetical protein [Alphaproteobacteria bacterium]